MRGLERPYRHKHRQYPEMCPYTLLAFKQQPPALGRQMEAEFMLTDGPDSIPFEQALYTPRTEKPC